MGMTPEGRRNGGGGGGAEDRGHEPDEEQAQAPGREQGVDHPPVEPADEEPLDHHPDDPHHEGREHEHRDPEVDPGVRRHHHRVAAQHQELAVGEVDDPHHPEDDRQPEADERQVGDPVENLQAYGGDEVHRTRPRSALPASCVPWLPDAAGRFPAYILIPAASSPFSNLKTDWFGSATRSQTRSVSVGGCAS